MEVRKEGNKMIFFRNIKFLSQLTYTNVREYFNHRSEVHSEPLVTDSIHWYGHATTLINISDTVIITDPVLSNNLGYFKRVVKRPFDIREQKLDYIILSHGHMDHLDFNSLRKLNRNTTIIVPKGYKRLMELIGYKNVVLLRQGEVFEDDIIKITALKAAHDGRRFYMGTDNESNAYLIESGSKKIFYAGDTAFTEDFNNLECDIALMPVGCYKPERFSYMHCSPQESYKMFKNMNCNAMIPIHYKTFKLSLEDFAETESILSGFKDKSLKILDVGQTYKF